MSLRLEAGDLLAAHPVLEDPNFARSVLLVCEHSASGAFGLVLNRPTDATVDQLLPEHPVLGGLEFPVLLGGPVDHSRLHFLHAVPGRIRGGSELRPGLWIGGDVDELGRYLLEQRRAGEGIDVRLFIGYAGWEEGQLDAELESGSWIPAIGRDEWIYGAPEQDVWQAVVSAAFDASDDVPPAPHEAN